MPGSSGRTASTRKRSKRSRPLKMTRPGADGTGPFLFVPGRGRQAGKRAVSGGLAATPAALAAAVAPQPDLFGEGRALGRVVRRDHRIVGGQAPAMPVLVGGHVVGGAQMPLQHLQFLAIL